MSLVLSSALPPPPPPAECFTPTGLSSVLVNKLSIPCAYRRDQYSLRQRVNRVEKLLKPTRGLSRKAKPPTRMENGPGALVYTSGAFPLGFIAPKPICSPNKNKCNSYFGSPLFVWVRPPFPLHLKEIQQKTEVHFYASHDFRPI